MNFRSLAKSKFLQHGVLHIFVSEALHRGEKCCVKKANGADGGHLSRKGAGSVVKLSGSLVEMAGL